jgi:hypothetical protein
VRTLSSVLHRTVVTESGVVLGRCFDVRGEISGSKLTLRSLCVGAHALVEHFGIGSHERHDEVAWSSIVRFERDTIVVRDP